EAEPLRRRSLAIREKALGPEHPEVGDSLNDLASLYESQRRFSEAEPLRERIVVIREKTLGPDHPTVGVALDNLAELYKAAGRAADAKPLHKRALAIKEKMAALEAEVVRLRDAGKYVEAAEVAKQTLAVLDKGELSPDQNDVGVALHRLAQLYRAQGRYA